MAMNGRGKRKSQSNHSNAKELVKSCELSVVVAMLLLTGGSASCFKSHENSPVYPVLLHTCFFLGGGFDLKATSACNKELLFIHRSG